MKKKKFAIVDVKRSDLVYGKGTGVSRKEAEDAWIGGFMEAARKKSKTKYKGLSGIQFRFW